MPLILSAQGAHERLRRFMHVFIATVLLLATLVSTQKIVFPHKASAVATPACGTSGTPTLVAQHGPNMYIDTGTGINSSYVAYTIRAGLSARSGMWIGIGSFTGGVVSLSSGES